MHNSKKGFTLAEILITLAIIGVIAAISIPVLMGETQDTEMKTALKKAVSVLNQAIGISIAQDSEDAATCNNCTTSQGLTDYFSNKVSFAEKDYTNSTFISADGIKYQFFKNGATACGTSESVDKLTADCYVLIDVNGNKKPNKISTGNTLTEGINKYRFKDQYYFIIFPKQVLPYKAGSITNPTDKVSSAALYE